LSWFGIKLHSPAPRFLACTVLDPSNLPVSYNQIVSSKNQGSVDVPMLCQLQANGKLEESRAVVGRCGPETVGAKVFEQFFGDDRVVFASGQCGQMGGELLLTLNKKISEQLKCERYTGCIRGRNQFQKGPIGPPKNLITQIWKIQNAKTFSKKKKKCSKIVWVRA
jgi:hypothetical protein